MDLLLIKLSCTVRLMPNIIEINKVMHKSMNTNVLKFHNMWEEHEAINLRTSIDLKLETLNFFPSNNGKVFIVN
jgi:hypothetical protein